MPRPSARQPTLEPVRFGEFLRERHLISDEQWLEALAWHWSNPGLRIGETIVEHGYLPGHVVESEARVFHDDLEVIEVVARSERTTVPLPAV
jgi:hypothetical protein